MEVVQMTEENSGQKTEQSILSFYPRDLLGCNICCSVQSTAPTLQVSETGLEAGLARIEILRLVLKGHEYIYPATKSNAICCTIATFRGETKSDFTHDRDTCEPLNGLLTRECLKNNL